MSADPLVDRKKVLALCEALAELGAAISVNDLANAWKDIARLRGDIRHGLMVGGGNGTDVDIRIVGDETTWIIEVLEAYDGNNWFVPPYYEFDSLDEALDRINDGDGGPWCDHRRRLVRVDERRTVIKVRGAHEKSGDRNK